MKLIDKYILKQILLYAMLCMSMFIFVLVIGKVIRDANEMLAISQVSLGMVAKLLLMLILYVINYALPLGLLTAILLVLGRMSAQREVVAFKASGISIYTMARSLFVLSIIGTLLCLFINTYYAPNAKTQYLKNMGNALLQDPLDYVRPRTFIKDFSGYIFYIEEKDNRNIKGVWLWELDPQGRVKIFIKAKEGNFAYDKTTQDILLTLKYGTGEMRNTDSPEDFKNTNLPLLSFEELSIRMPFGELFSKDIDLSQRKLSTLDIFDLMKLRKLYKIAGDHKNQIKVQVEIQRKASMAFSVLALVLIAVPLGIKTSRSETYANLAIALILAMIYYGLTMAIKALDGFTFLRPDLLIWLPNILFVVLGIFLLKKANHN